MTRAWQAPWLVEAWAADIAPWRVGLAHAGVGLGDRVAIDLPRCAAWVHAVLGIWSLGASAVPLDPRWPSARRAACVQRAGCRAHVGRPMPGAASSWVGPMNGNSPARVGFDASREAWVCFSSGSTGRPKGIAVGFAGVEGLVRAQRTAFALAPGMRVGWALSPGFDASFSDVLTALDAGAVPVCAPPGLLARPDALVAWLEASQVACIDLPPALLPHISPERLPRTLQTVVVGGEVADPDALRAWARRVRVVAVYGPTEATVCTHLAVVDPETWQRAALGTPIEGVVDAVVQDGRLCGPDEPGELWLAGPCLALGYVDAPDLTAERFCDVDLGDGLRRWFRTRDRVVRTRDPVGQTGGQLLFLGRMDRVVKVAGQLVALPEVEAELERQAGVRAAAVVHVDGGLVAFLEGSGLPEEALRSALAQALPPYMVPRRVETLAKLPRGTSGKVRHAELARRAQAMPALAPSASDLAQVCAAWSAALGRPVRADASLAMLGRDSLATLRVHARLQQLGMGTSIAALAEADTARAYWARRHHGFDLADLAEWVPASEHPDTATPGGSARGPRVLLLGATGFVGSAVMAEWCADPTRPGLVVLVRAPSVAAAQARVRTALASCGWRERVDPIQSGHLVVVPGDLQQPRLGLSDVRWRWLAAQTGLVVDLAGKVSLAADFSSLRAALVNPIAEVARLADAAGRVGVVHAGTLSVFVERLPRVAQAVVDGAPLPQSGRLGSAYAAAKWVAERAWERCAPGPLHVLRFGLVVGDTVTGVPAQGGQLAALLRAVARGDLPRSVDPQAAINLTPRDLAARAAVAEIAQCWNAPSQDRRARHIVHARSATLAELQAACAGVSIEPASPELLASTLVDPFATGFLSTGVAFVPQPGARLCVPTLADAAWRRFLRLLVRRAVDTPPLAGLGPTGQIGSER